MGLNDICLSLVSYVTAADMLDDRWRVSDRDPVLRDLTVCYLKRPRHSATVTAIRNYFIPLFLLSETSLIFF